MAITVNEEGVLHDVTTYSRPYIAVYNGNTPANGTNTSIPDGAYHGLSIGAGKTLTWTFDFVPQKAVFICHNSSSSQMLKQSFYIAQGTTVTAGGSSEYGFYGTESTPMRGSISLIDNKLTISNTGTGSHSAKFILIVV